VNFGLVGVASIGWLSGSVLHVAASQNSHRGTTQAWFSVLYTAKPCFYYNCTTAVKELSIFLTVYADRNQMNTEGPT
jgi:hypothetical protein